jgi:hypothetical protein
MLLLYGVQVPIQFRGITPEFSRDKSAVNRGLAAACAQPPLCGLIELDCLQSVDPTTFHAPEPSTQPCCTLQLLNPSGP